MSKEISRVSSLQVSGLTTHRSLRDPHHDLIRIIWTKAKEQNFRATDACGTLDQRTSLRKKKRHAKRLIKGKHISVRSLCILSWPNALRNRWRKILSPNLDSSQYSSRSMECKLAYVNLDVTRKSAVLLIDLIRIAYSSSASNYSDTLSLRLLILQDVTLILRLRHGHSDDYYDTVVTMCVSIQIVRLFQYVFVVLSRLPNLIFVFQVLVVLILGRILHPSFKST